METPPPTPPILNYAHPPRPRPIAPLLWFIVVGLGCGILLFLSATIGHFRYEFTRPLTILAALSTLLCLGGWFLLPRWKIFMLPTLLGCILQPIAALYAISRWPGGDDGGGMAWIILVIPASFLLAAISALWALILLTRRA